MTMICGLLNKFAALLLIATVTKSHKHHDHDVKEKWPSQTTWYTDEDKPTDIDLTRNTRSVAKDNLRDCKATITTMPSHGYLEYSSGKLLRSQTEFLINVTISYHPNFDFFGEDTFFYSLFCKNISIPNNERSIKIVVKPQSDPITLKDDTILVNSHRPVHIPVLLNAQSVDDPDMCMIETYDSVSNRDHSPNDHVHEVTFLDVADDLGMTAAQAMISTSPNCLFDNWDVKHKRWIKGSFCMVDTLFGGAAAGDFDDDGNLDIYYARVDGEDQLWKNFGNGSFAMVTYESNLTQTAHHHSSAVVWLDIDNDGDSDVYVGTSGDKRHFLYVNDGMGHFTEDAERRGLATHPEIAPFQTSCQSIGVGDFNNDGWLDVYTTEWLVHLNQEYDYNNASHSGVRLLKNLGSAGKPGFFEDVTVSAQLGEKPRPEIPVTLFDFRPYNLEIHGSFADIAPGPYQFSATFADIDDDGFQDLLITGDFKTSRLYWNNGNGTFTDGTDQANLGTDENAMGSTVADYDLDGRQDWFITSIYDSRKLEDVQVKDEPFFQKTGYIFGSTGNRLYKYEGERKFSDRTDEAGVREGGWGWGAAFFDFDNDGDLDILHTNGWDDPETTDTDFFHNVPNVLFKNTLHETGQSRFTSVGGQTGVGDRRDGRGLFVFDYDKDGDQDVFIVNIWDKPILYQNRNGNQRAWIRVKVLECCVNRESLGAKVYLHSPKHDKEILREVRSASSFSGHGENIAHFGLGSETAEDEFDIRIYWPITNNTRIIKNVPRRSFLQVRDMKGVKNTLETTLYLTRWVGKCPQMVVGDIVTSPTKGRVVHHGKYLTYQVKPGGDGDDSFTYSVTNGESSGIGTVHIKIQSSDEGTSKIQEDAGKSPYASYSGYGNNLHHPNWGKAMSALHRLVPPAYSDGYQSFAGNGRPNPRLISNVLCQQTAGADVLSAEDLNEMHVHFGQLVAHDTDFSSPFANTLATENMAIEIPSGDPYFDPFSTGRQMMRFRRSARQPNSGDFKDFPREQINKVSAYLDLSVIYGSDDGRARMLRAGRHGMLKLDADANLPFNDDQIPNLNLLGAPRERLLVSGDTRVNVQPGLIALHTLFVREHNKVCDELRTHSFMRDADDETLYQTARTMTRAKWQAIVWYEFLPTVIGSGEFQNLGDYQGYNNSVELRIFNEFATTAFRYGHSQIGNTLHRFDGSWKTLQQGHLNLRDAYFNPGRILNEGGIGALIRGMLVKEAQNVDTQFVDGVRNFLFGTNTQGLDLVSYGIQRGRDHGIPDYNTVRKVLGLTVRKSFSEITTNKAVQEKFQFLYKNINDVDLWMGGLAEQHVEGGCVGETFARIIAKQFNVLRSGDRFWFENPDIDTLFGRLRGYAETRFGDILKRNTGIEWPGSAFHAHPWKKYTEA